MAGLPAKVFDPASAAGLESKDAATLWRTSLYTYRVARAKS